MKIHLVLILLFWSSLSFAANTCYKFRIEGGVVDVNLCQSVQLSVEKFDCNSKARKGIESSLAQLSNCKNSSADVSLSVDGNFKKMKAIKTSQMGVELWEIQDNAKKSTFNLAVKKKVVKPQEPKKRVSKWTKLPLTVDLYFESYYLYNFNTPDQTTTPAAENELRLNDAYHNELTFGVANLSLDYKSDRKFFHMDITTGENIVLWLDPFASVRDEVYLRQFYFGYQKKKNQFILGRFDNPQFEKSFFSIENMNYSLPILNSIAMARYFTGILWNRIWSNSFRTNMFLANGENQDRTNEGGPSFGITARYKLSSSFRLHSSFYIGTDNLNPADNSKTYDRNYLTLGMRYQLSKSFEVFAQYVLGSFGEQAIGLEQKDISYTDMELSLFYSISDRSHLGFRFELYDEAEGLSTGNTDLNSIQSITTSFRREFLKDLFWTLEFRFDMNSDIAFAKGDNEFADNLMSLNNVISYRW